MLTSRARVEDLEEDMQQFDNAAWQRTCACVCVCVP